MVAALLGIPESCCGGGRISGPLAREIPDIFRHGWRRAGKFRNDDRGGVSSGLRAASGEDGTPPCGGAGEGV